MATNPTSWSNPTATPSLTYRQKAGMTYNQAGRTYNASEQTGAAKLYDGILEADLRAGATPPTTWT